MTNLNPDGDSGDMWVADLCGNSAGSDGIANIEGIQ